MLLTGFISRLLFGELQICIIQQQSLPVFSEGDSWKLYTFLSVQDSSFAGNAICGVIGCAMICRNVVVSLRLI